MKWHEIQVKGRELGLKTAGIRKAELIRGIQRAEGNFECFGKADGYCDQWGCCFRSLCLNKNNK
jgi:hypothetical protein